MENVKGIMSARDLTLFPQTWLPQCISLYLKFENDCLSFMIFELYFKERDANSFKGRRHEAAIYLSSVHGPFARLRQHGIEGHRGRWR